MSTDSKGQENGKAPTFSDGKLGLHFFATDPLEEGKYFKWDRNRMSSLTPMEIPKLSHQEGEPGRVISPSELSIAASRNGDENLEESFCAMFDKGLLETMDATDVTRPLGHDGSVTEELPAAASFQTGLVGQSTGEQAYQGEGPPGGSAAASDEEGHSMWQYLIFPDDTVAYEHPGPLEAHGPGLYRLNWLRCPQCNGMIRSSNETVAHGECVKAWAAGHSA